MHCIIIAGGIPEPDDPMYAYTLGKPKSLLDMNGRTMLERVIDALQAAHSIEDIVVVGLGDDMGMTFQRPVYHLPDTGSLPGNFMAGIAWLDEHRPGEEVFLACSADIPAITPAIVDAYIDSCRPFERAGYYNMVTKETMETRFPHSYRTFVKLKGVQIAGGDMTVLRLDVARRNRELVESLTQGRKHAWKLARLVGLGTLFKFLTRQLSLTDLEAISGRVLGNPIKVVLSPYAEVAMDADKPDQVDLLRDEFL